MSILSIITTVQKAISVVTAVRYENRKLKAELRDVLIWISKDLDLIHEGNENYHNLQMQELVYDIERFICRLYIPTETAGFILSMIGSNPCAEDISTIKGYQVMIKTIHERIKAERDELRQKTSESTQSESGASTSSGPPSYTPEKDLVGFSGAKEDVLKLLVQADGGHLRVISIVGCKGSGKTALARAVYEGTVVPGEFGCKAWVVVPECKDGDDRRLMKIGEEILQEILQQVRPACVESTSKALVDILKENRYLICIDGVHHQEVWDKIKVVFPDEEGELDSRILVTTNVHSIANACSRGSYVYKMQSLDLSKSKELFQLKALGPSQVLSQAEVYDSENIFNKCDGLPLALISAGKHLHKQFGDCCDVGKAFGEYLRGNAWAFAEIKRVLVHCYDNLPDYNHKHCLLYASIFPRGHQIKSKSLARRLIAEDLVDKDIEEETCESLLILACKCLEELINQSLVERVLVDNGSKVVERCIVQSTVLEFCLNMSLLKNFVTLFDEKGTTGHKYGRVRRLITVQSSTKDRIGQLGNIDLSTVRSFTILKHNLLQLAPDFKMCEVLRVLDVEGCTGLENGVLNSQNNHSQEKKEGVLDVICGLPFLTYLGMRKTDVHKLPGNVKCLMLLQTLDIRETKVETLCMEVIMLPELAYLFGKFELQPIDHGKRDVKEFLSTKSKLHTLAGILIDRDDGPATDIEVIIEHARFLRKVKVWWKESSKVPVQKKSSKDKQVVLDPAPFTAHIASTSDGIRTIPVRRKPNRWFACLGLVRGMQGRTGIVQNSVEGEAVSASGIVQNSVEGDAVSASGIVQNSVEGDAVSASGIVQNSVEGEAVSASIPEGNILVSRFVSALRKRPIHIGLDSLSIDFNGVPNGFLDSLNTTSPIKSIKVRRALGNLQDLSEVRNLRKLHLFSTGRRIEYLAALQSLVCLQYLKLAEDDATLWEENFHVKANGFNSILWLCFEAPKHPRILIDNGGMTRLASLLLLCPESPSQNEEAKDQKKKGKMDEAPGIEEAEEKVGVKGISSLQSLNEVTLHRSAPVTMVDAWKTASNLHMNKPHVKKQDISTSNQPAPGRAVEHAA